MARHRISSEVSRIGRRVKSDRASSRRWSIYNTLRVVAREEGIAPTLKGIAEQLNARGLWTTRGNPFDFRKVGAALDALGLDRVAVERWKQLARDRAQEWGVPPAQLYHQLWMEWQRHVTIRADPFVPRLIHPDEWIPPGSRDESPDWRFISPPPQARFVHLFLGAFTDEAD